MQIILLGKELTSLCQSILARASPINTLNTSYNIHNKGTNARVHHKTSVAGFKPSVGDFASLSPIRESVDIRYFAHLTLPMPHARWTSDITGFSLRIRPDNIIWNVICWRYAAHVRQALLRWRCLRGWPYFYQYSSAVNNWIGFMKYRKQHIPDTYQQNFIHPF